VDRLLFAQEGTDAEPSLLDHVAAVAAGWRWRSSAVHCRVKGIAYASAHLGDDAAFDSLGGSAEAPVRIAAGFRPDPWLRNCVAIGDSAVAVEPLEWTNLHLAHGAIDRIVTMLPDRDCAPVELAEYNRQTRAEAERVRDFILLHYATARRPEPFWREAAAVELPGSLAHSLALFRERGRLPFFEEETFARDSWLVVLFGQGVMPRRVDPLTDAVPPAEALQAMAAMRHAIEQAALALPAQTRYLHALSRAGDR
jgi:tryptophan 7-halogenase